MSFRHRLALFLVVTLVCVQALAALFVYGYLRHDLVDRAKRELTAETGEFARQLNFLSEQVTDGVQLLALDYALRAAIARQDHDTALSVLRNHGRRIDATRMMLIGLDGKISTDTAARDATSQMFPFRRLLQAAAGDDEGTGLTTIDGKIYWVVVVPVRAPVPIAFIAACIPVDDNLLAKLRAISAYTESIALATTGANNHWTIAAHSGDAIPRINLPTAPRFAKTISTATTSNGHDYLTIVAPLNSAPEGKPIAVVMAYPLDEALAVYRAVVTAMLMVLVLALVAAVAGAMLVVRDVSRPLETLAAAARRIAAGDYTPPPRFKRRDEVGDLADALVNMTHSIAEREAALTGAIESMEVTRREAVHASEAKSQFLTNMSHELRTPLNAIVGFSEMIEQQILGPVGVPRYSEYARNIHGSGRQLLDLVQRMLDLSEAESGRLAIARDSIAPGILLRESVILLKSFSEQYSVSIVLADTVTAWPRMAGDAPKLRQTFINLLHNAIRFSPAGAQVEVAGAVDSARLVMRITDHGIGISPELLPVVTRPFHRLRSALDGRHQGAGLGLPFAKAVIELHGGTFALHSTPGAGTVVVIELPVLASSMSHAA